MGKLTISMAIFHSYVSLPEGNWIPLNPSKLIVPWVTRSTKLPTYCSANPNESQPIDPSDPSATAASPDASRLPGPVHFGHRFLPGLSASWHLRGGVNSPGRWLFHGKISAVFRANMRDWSKKGVDLPDAKHGAGISTKLGHENGVFMSGNIPAPWFASGYRLEISRELVT